MTSEGEPAEKRQRSTRQIDIDLNNFPPWVETASEEELIRVFRIGVTVRDSVEIETDIKFRHEDIHGILSEKFNAISENLQAQTRRAQHEREQSIKELKGCKAKIKHLGTSIAAPLNQVVAISSAHEEQLNKVARIRDKAPVKGSLGENDVYEILQELTSHTVRMVAKIGNAKGDINVQSPAGNNYLIEVKNHEYPIKSQEITKFEADVKKAPKDFQVGILISLKSAIQGRAQGRKFEITCVDERYFIYVPNALVSRDENLVIWAVLVADELVALNQNLGNTQRDELEALYKEFKENVECIKACKQNLKSLELAIKGIKENLTPFLKVVENAGKKIRKILHPKK